MLLQLLLPLQPLLSQSVRGSAGVGGNSSWSLSVSNVTLWGKKTLGYYSDASCAIGIIVEQHLLGASLTKMQRYLRRCGWGCLAEPGRASAAGGVSGGLAVIDKSHLQLARCIAQPGGSRKRGLAKNG
jgi:hypothetical protein